MSNILVKRGFHTLHKNLTTIIELPVLKGVVHVLYIDTDHNTKNPHSDIRTAINKNIDTDRFNEDHVRELIEIIDDIAYERDFILRDLILIWKVDNETIIGKCGSGLIVRKVCWGWDEPSISVVLRLPNQTDNLFYIGSGARFCMTERFFSDDRILINSEETQFYMNKRHGRVFNLNEYILKGHTQESFNDIIQNLDEKFGLTKTKPSKDIIIMSL